MADHDVMMREYTAAAEANRLLSTLESRVKAGTLGEDERWMVAAARDFLKRYFEAARDRLPAVFKPEGL